MEQYNVIQTKAKRVRSNPTRKWLIEEDKALTEFLTQNRDFEKPTSQMYYRRFSEESNIAVDWKLTRSNVRYIVCVQHITKQKHGCREYGRRNYEG